MKNWYHNRIDHTMGADNRTYKQRFWYNFDDFDEADGTIIVYICGEYTCTVPDHRKFVAQLAKENKAAYFVVEHRYYGESQPTENWSLENMKYLTISNGLADLATFIFDVQKFIKTTTKSKTSKRKLMVVGGSYPGAMAAWFRYKYPHLADAAIASSAVVLAVEDFYHYDV